MTNQFHSLLASRSSESLLGNLDLPEHEEQALVDAAKEIRSVIVAGFADLREKVKRQRLEHEVPKPKFAIQGSYAYGTLNAPAYPPQQQVDIDLGIYLPFSALGNGQQPKTATGYYFDAVTQILEAHVQSKRNNWTIPKGENQKDNCVRVLLSEKTHIDIPLYAVPEGELHRITEEQLRVMKANEQLPEMIRDSEFFFDTSALEAVDPSVIHMAHRKKGWQPSDALAIRDWVKSHFRQMGSMIRPVNRFLKAWRDETWPNGGGPSSIFLLSHSLASFPSNTNGLSHCDALEAVINELPSVLDSPVLVPCPTPEDKDAKEDLRRRISDKEAEEYSRQFVGLRDNYAQAKREDPKVANAILINLFGERMPFDPTRIVVTSAVASTVASIRNTKPDVRPLHTTDRSTSG
jgi:hypothetical protein